MKEVAPVPPLATARVPLSVGLKVKAPAELVMLRPRVSPVVAEEEVAKVIAPVCAVPPPSCWSERRPVLVMVTAPVAPLTLIPVPATFEVTPVLVITPVAELYEMPVPPESDVELILLLKLWKRSEERRVGKEC